MRKKNAVQEVVEFSEADELEALRQMKIRITELENEGKKPKEIIRVLKSETSQRRLALL